MLSAVYVSLSTVVNKTRLNIVKCLQTCIFIKIHEDKTHHKNVKIKKASSHFTPTEISGGKQLVK